MMTKYELCLYNNITALPFIWNKFCTCLQCAKGYEGRTRVIQCKDGGKWSPLGSWEGCSPSKYILHGSY